MTSDEKLLELGRAIRCAELGPTKVVPCPYCGGQNDFGVPSPPPLCCEKFAAAAVAVVAEREMAEQVEIAERALEAHAGRALLN